GCKIEYLIISTGVNSYNLNYSLSTFNSLTWVFRVSPKWIIVYVPLPMDRVINGKFEEWDNSGLFWIGCQNIPGKIFEGIWWPDLPWGLSLFHKVWPMP